MTIRKFMNIVNESATGRLDEKDHLDDIFDEKDLPGGGGAGGGAGGGYGGHADISYDPSDYAQGVSQNEYETNLKIDEHPLYAQLCAVEDAIADTVGTDTNSWDNGLQSQAYSLAAQIARDTGIRAFDIRQYAGYWRRSGREQGYDPSSWGRNHDMKTSGWHWLRKLVTGKDLWDASDSLENQKALNRKLYPSNAVHDQVNEESHIPGDTGGDVWDPERGPLIPVDSYRVGNRHDEFGANPEIENHPLYQRLAKVTDEWLSQDLPGNDPRNKQQRTDIKNLAAQIARDTGLSVNSVETYAEPQSVENRRDRYDPQSHARASDERDSGWHWLRRLVTGQNLKDPNQFRARRTELNQERYPENKDLPIGPLDPNFRPPWWPEGKSLNDPIGPDEMPRKPR